MKLFSGVTLLLVLAMGASGASAQGAAINYSPVPGALTALVGEVSPRERLEDLKSGFDDLWNAACCKVCKKGKACGDSCINRNYTCHKGKGCACDG